MQGVMQNRFMALFLGLWVALAPAVMAMPAAAMTLEACLSADGARCRSDDCAGADRACAVCAVTCLNAAHFGIAAERGKQDIVASRGRRLERHQALSGLLAAPDPAPPKPVVLR